MRGVSLHERIRDWWHRRRRSRDVLVDLDWWPDEPSSRSRVLEPRRPLLPSLSTGLALRLPDD